jgi:hypothetical protein
LFGSDVLKYFTVYENWKMIVVMSNDNNTSVWGSEFYVANLLKCVNLLVVINSQHFVCSPGRNLKTIFELDIGFILSLGDEKLA